VPAAYVLLRKGNEVLLQLRSGTGYMDDHWACAAAGHVEKYETVFAAACRETAEELGVTIDAADLRPLTAMHRTHFDHAPIDERVDFFFECDRWQGDPRLVETTKAAGLDWFALDALPDPVVPHEKYVLDGVRTGTLPTVSVFGF
jgi:8-oxo-dGTP diphosphatase